MSKQTISQPTHQPANPSASPRPIKTFIMAKLFKPKRRLVQYFKLLFFGSWCVMFGFMIHDVSKHNPPVPKSIPPVSGQHQREFKERSKEPPIPLLQRQLPGDIPLEDIKEDDLLIYNKPVRNKPKAERKKTASKYSKTKQEIMEQEQLKRRVGNQAEKSVPVKAPKSRKHSCQINYVINNLNEGWFHPKEHVDLLRGCEAVIYNRVPKCGSRSVLETFKYLAKANNFTVYDRETPYGGKRSHFDVKSDLGNFVSEFFALQKPFLYSQHLHHVDFSTYSRSAENMPIYINLVRHPVERFISHYYYLQYGSYSENNSDPGTAQKTNGMSLDECVEAQDVKKCMNLKNFIPFFCGHDRICRKNTGSILAHTKLVVSQQYLVVGLTEDITSFMYVLESLMPHMFGGAVDRFNQVEAELKSKYQTVKKPEVKESTRKYLHVLLRNEIELYDFMKERFRRLLDLIQVMKKNFGLE